MLQRWLLCVLSEERKSSDAPKETAQDEEDNKEENLCKKPGEYKNIICSQ